MKRTASARILVILLLAALLVGGFFVGRWYLTEGRYPLKGELRHDFGIIPITGRGGAKSHTFRLTNTTEAPVVIESVKSSCGCTAVDLQDTTVAPGGRLDLPVTLSLTMSARKQSNIKLMIRDFGVQTLFIEGVGRHEPPLRTVDAWPGLPMPLTIFLEVHDSNDKPQAPQLRTPEGLSATFTDWTPVKQRNRMKAQPAIWRGQVKFEATGIALPVDAQLVIVHDDVHELRVPLTPKPAPNALPIPVDNLPEQADRSAPMMAPGPLPAPSPAPGER